MTPTGHLIFGSLDGQILAAPFDAEHMELTGAAVPLVEGVFVTRGRYPIYSLSPTGALVYLAGAGGGGQSEFVWVTRSGQATPVDPGYTFTPGESAGWRLSPDETRVAFASTVDGNTDVRIKHLPDGPEERITFSDDPDPEYSPFWTLDGQSVTYFSGPRRDEHLSVWSMRADGTGEPVLVLDDDRSFAQGSWSPDGESLVLRSADRSAERAERDILGFRPGVDSVAVPLVASPAFREGGTAISPNGLWLAYSTTETGRAEVFVRPFPNVDSTRVRVSTDGGIVPVWAKSGRELFFMSPDRGFMAAQFDPASGLVVAKEMLFTVPAGYRMVSGTNSYDVSSDGERFLMARPAVGDTQAEVEYILVQNFFEELKRLVPN